MFDHGKDGKLHVVVIIQPGGGVTRRRTGH